MFIARKALFPFSIRKKDNYENRSRAINSSPRRGSFRQAPGRGPAEGLATKPVGALALYFASICSRIRASCSLSSGVNSAPKSSASNTWRTSTSVSSKGARLSHSIASSRDLHFHNQKPATSSFVSANGPSITDFCPFENLTRAHIELG